MCLSQATETAAVLCTCFKFGRASGYVHTLRSYDGQSAEHAAADAVGDLASAVGGLRSRLGRLNERCGEERPEREASGRAWEALVARAWQDNKAR